MLLCGCVLWSAYAHGATTPEDAPPSQGPVHYHFGDDPQGQLGWAGANFNDSAWPVAPQGRWPEPQFHSDGFVWVRFRVKVRSDAAEPLAIRIGNPRGALIADEVFVNGTEVGTFGRLPPHPWVNSLPQDAIFNLPPGVAQPGTAAVVALRFWYPPFNRRKGVFDTAAIAFDQSRTLHAEEAAARSQALLSNVPALALAGFIFLIGFTVLLVARSLRSRDLLLYGAMLASFPWITIFLELVSARLVSLSVQEYFPLQVLSELPAMIVTVAFIWGINHLSDVWLKRLAYAAMWVFNVLIIVAYVPDRASALVTISYGLAMVALRIFNVITLGVLLWVLFVVRRKRLIAFAMALPPLGSFLAGFRVTYAQGQGQHAFDLAFFLAGIFLSVALALEAWKEWRARDTLQAEFEAAREVQERLVTPAANVPGFRIESVYAPAAQVGGDFFHVVAEGDGSVLVVVGDVSGKGLKAALTVSAMIGALRTMPPLPPGRILAALNRGLVGQMQAGFVTCCAARIGAGGTITMANAGHLAPYRSGEELNLPPGLPLGLSADATYEETTLQLTPEDTLTFLSDGVVEARDEAGELFGFERTRGLSCQSAQAIAQAAQRFGQQDDITVLKVEFAPAPAAVA